jgi:hypothetical protein
VHSAPAQAKAEKGVRASRIEVSQEVDECAFRCCGGRGREAFAALVAYRLKARQDRWASGKENRCCSCATTV